MPDELATLQVEELVGGVVTRNHPIDPTTLTSDPFDNPIPDGAQYRVRGVTTAGQTIQGISDPLQTTPPQSVVSAIGVGGTETDYIIDMTTDPNGNVYVTGVFSGTVDFTGTDGGTPEAILTSQAGYDVFVAKYAPGFGLLMVKQFPGAHGELPRAIAVGDFGNIYICGILPGGSLMKLDSDGVVQWIRGPDPQQLGLNQIDFQSVAIDSTERVSVTGYFHTNPGPIELGDSHPITSVGATDVFLCQYDTDGVCLWAKTFAGDATSGAYGRAVAVDRRFNAELGQYYDTIAVCGYAFSAINLGGGPVQNGAIRAYGFLGKFDSSGTHLWSKAIGTSQASDPSRSFSRAACLAIDPVQGDVVVGGEWNAVADFGSGPRTFTTQFNNLFLAKYASDGTASWDRPINGSNSADARSLVVDASGNIFFVGTFTGSYSFGTKVLTSPSPLFPSSDAFAAAYTTNNAPWWATQFGGTGIDIGAAVGLGIRRSVIVGGYFNRNIDGSSPQFGAVQLTNRGREDAFLVEIGLNR